MKHIKKITIILAIFIFCSCKPEHHKDYYPNGTLRYEYYKSRLTGRTTGTYKEYYENGKIRTIGQSRDGRMTGIWKTYWENGKIQSIQNLKDNRVISIEFWDSDGVQTIKDGTGVGAYYDDDGQISSTISYKNNVPDGKFEHWYPYGYGKESETYYRNGKIVYSKQWDVNGKLIEEK